MQLPFFRTFKFHRVLVNQAVFGVKFLFEKPVSYKDPGFIFEKSLGSDDLFKNVSSYVGINSR